LSQNAITSQFYLFLFKYIKRPLTWHRGPDRCCNQTLRIRGRYLH